MIKFRGEILVKIMLNIFKITSRMGQVFYIFGFVLFHSFPATSAPSSEEISSPGQVHRITNVQFLSAPNFYATLELNDCGQITTIAGRMQPGLPPRSLDPAITVPQDKTETQYLGQSGNVCLHVFRRKDDHQTYSKILSSDILNALADIPTYYLMKLTFQKNERGWPREDLVISLTTQVSRASRPF